MRPFSLFSYSVASWHEPKPLLQSRGALWPYQHGDQIQKILAAELPDHFGAWKQQKTDKMLHPLFIVASGPGTGKSRLLQGMSQC